MFVQRIATLVVVLSLSLSVATGALVASPGQAHAGIDGGNPSELCTEFLESLLEAFLEFGEGIEVDVSHGACVSLVAAGNFTALATNICKSPDVEPQFRNRGECLRFVKTIIDDIFD